MGLQTLFDNFSLLADTPNGVTKLRELILQLAVEGKLVSQHSNDGSADDLLRKIKTQKSKLINGKHFKAPDSLSKSGAPFGLPKGWVWTRLGEIVIMTTGFAFKSSDYSPAGIFVLRVTNIQPDGKINKDEPVYFPQEKLNAQITKYFLHEYDLLVVMVGGSLGKIGIVTPNLLPALLNQNMWRIKPIGLSHEFLLLLLKYINAHRLKITSSTHGHLIMGEYQEQVVGLPPIEEQNRIVAKVDELMRLCDELEARQNQRRESRMRLNNATLAPLNEAASLTPEEFKQASVRLANNFETLYDSVQSVGNLRSTILQLAVQGKLVPQNPHDEPASILVERIKKKKAEKVQDSKIKKVEQLPSIKEDEIAFALPHKWRWTRLAEVCELITKGSSPKWQGVNYVNEGEGVLFVTSENVGSFRMIFENRKYVEARFNDIEPRSILRRNDVLMNIVGASIGRTALFESDELANINQAVCLIRVAEDSLLPYLLHFLNSETCIQMMFDKQVDNARANLSMGNIAKFPIPLPPLTEQKRIVAKVNQLMALCDDLETKLRQAEADSEKLMNAAVQHVLATVSRNSASILTKVSA